MNIFIKKVNLSNFADNRYWGNFGKLTELPFDTYQMLKLIDFYQAIEAYREYSRLYLTLANDGFTFRFFNSPDSPLEGYMMYGLVDSDNYKKIITTGDVYADYVIKRDIVFAELGWTIVDERVSVIDSEFVDVSVDWTNIPDTALEVQELYNSGTEVSQFLGD
jgi:hypothetical protein